METSVKFNNRLEYDTMGFLYLSLPIQLIGQLLGAFLLSAMEFTVVDTETVGVWLLLNIVMFLYRFYHYQLFKKVPETEKHRHVTLWLHRYYTNVLISGIIWGSSAFLLFPDKALLNQFILLLFLFAIGFTSMGVLATKKDLLLAYVSVMYGPILWRLFSIGDNFYTLLGYAIMALVLIMLLISNYYGKTIEKALIEKLYFVDLKTSHEKLKERFFSLFDRAPVGIYYYDDAMRIEDVNQSFLTMNKLHDKKEFVGVSLNDIVESSNFIDVHQKVFDGKTGHYKGPFELQHMKDYHNTLYVDISTVPMFNNNHEIAGGVTIVNDITAEVTAKEKILRNAYFDLLTNIPNRTFLLDKLQTIIDSKKITHNYAALLFLDINNFKKINNTYGHDIGDKVIKKVVYRIDEVLGGKETFARVGGDKFVILISRVGKTEEESKQYVLEYVDKLHQTFSNALDVFGKAHYISFSVGSVIFSQTDDSAFDIFKKSETAMYEAKVSSNNRVQFYENKMSEKITEELLLENGIPRAARNDEFTIYYQPQLDVETGKIIGAEALIRWNHPEKGLVMPTEFIPLAEESGKIIQIGDWVFKKVFKDAHEIIEGMNGFPLKHIAINVSTVHFMDPHFIENLLLLVQEYNVDPHWFELEITESGIMRNIHDAAEKIRKLKSFGFTFSIDDFGTGHSSLAYLKELPVDVIKIDQSFIRQMNADDEKLVEVIASIGKKFNMDVLAEGVETESALRYLKTIKCNTYQGFYSYEPLIFDEFVSIAKSAG